jgi:hypothetical protein
MGVKNPENTGRTSLTVGVQDHPGHVAAPQRDCAAQRRLDQVGAQVVADRPPEHPP